MALCLCGCGQPTSIATKTDKRIGVIKGLPRRFAIGHAREGSYRTPEQKLTDQRVYLRKWSRVRSASIIKHYGGKCACCGESRREFLALDHIGGGGNKHRKSLKTNGGGTFYAYLHARGYPHGYRVLCHNCNQARGSYGYCPHEIVKIKPAPQVMARMAAYY